MNRRKFMTYLTTAAGLVSAAAIYLKPENILANASLDKNQKVRKVMKLLGMDKKFPAQALYTVQNYSDTARKNPSIVKDKTFAKQLENTTYQRTVANKAYSRYLQHVSKAVNERDLATIITFLESDAGKAYTKFREVEGDSIRKVHDNYFGQINKRLFKLNS